MNKREKELVRSAYERCKVLREGLRKLGGCMEATEDKYGIVWERWLLNNGRNAILFSTPHWCDIFVSVAPDDGTYDGTLAALARFNALPMQPKALSYGSAQGGE